jgi:hypothetical protein
MLLLGLLIRRLDDGYCILMSRVSRCLIFFDPRTLGQSSTPFGETYS